MPEDDKKANDYPVGKYFLYKKDMDWQVTGLKENFIAIAVHSLIKCIQFRSLDILALLHI
jgi:hypothetical protein